VGAMKKGGGFFDVQPRTLRRGAGGQGVERELQGFNHHAGKRADPHLERTEGRAICRGDGVRQEVIHQAQFVHVGPFYHGLRGFTK